MAGSGGLAPAKGMAGKGTARVSLVSGNGRQGNIKGALERIKGDLGELWKAKRILVKPNFTAAYEGCANTSVQAVEAVIEFIAENHPNFGNVEITVGECSATAFYLKQATVDVFQRCGYSALGKKYKNLKLLPLDGCKKFRKHEVECIGGKTVVRVCMAAEEFDYVISVAVPKTHNFAIYTGAAKNMMGFVKNTDMALIHGLKRGSAPGAPRTLLDRLPPGFIPWVRRNIPARLVDLLFMAYPNYKKAVKIINRNLANVLAPLLPDLAVIDGFYGMEGNGPVNGEPVKLGVAIASTDALKADGIACRLMGFEPDGVGYLYYMQKRGLGDYSTKGLVGETNISRHKRAFKPHGTYLVQRNWR